MRKVILYIGMSLDGYIADKNEKVDWLSGQNAEAESMDSYSEFIRDIDTVIMGWNTYEQVVTELSPDEWVYSGMESYVLTHREIGDKEEIKFTNQDVGELIRELKKKDGKDIWICGGASIVNQLIRENLIDRYHISVIPTILGNGIRLFEKADRERKLNLIKTQTYNGITDLIYEPRIFLRRYEPADCETMAKLFYDTVHTVNATDYTKEQLDVWADGKVDLEKWNQSFLEHYSIVAIQDDEIVGFGDMAEDGYLDRLYVHKDYQKKGIATAICNKLENYTDAATIITHASITAKPFFEKRGYETVKEQQVERKGILLTNYVMQKLSLH